MCSNIGAFVTDAGHGNQGKSFAGAASTVLHCVVIPMKAMCEAGTLLTVGVPMLICKLHAQSIADTMSTWHNTYD